MNKPDPIREFLDSLELFSTIGSTRVTTDGATTTYANYDAANNLTDVETICGNTISTTMYDPKTHSLLGLIESRYEADGTSQTTYRRCDEALTSITQKRRTISQILQFGTRTNSENEALVRTQANYAMSSSYW